MQSTIVRLASFGVLCTSFIVQPAWAHGGAAHPSFVMTEKSKLQRLGIPVLFDDAASGLAVTYGTNEITSRLSADSHLNGKCAGFDALPDGTNPAEELKRTSQVLRRQTIMENMPLLPRPVTANPQIEKMLGELSSANIQATVQWLSSYPNRFNRAANPNKHVDDLQTKLTQMTAGSKMKIEISQIAHRSTPQKSLRLHIEGSERPNEIVVLGAHLDSINGWGSATAIAPGADDNASGSADLIEALRMILTNDVAPARTLEFFWYAGEESGLLGSNEIAESYKQANKDVVGVLQLDMTLFPGNGELVIGNVTDYTNAWLRDYFAALNDTYIHARIVQDACGYACSDHASWHKRGYAAFTPFEATTETMNPDIHTARDVISNKSSFTHALAFAKIALVYALDLGNSTQRPPRI